jgi:hypothetical protein
LDTGKSSIVWLSNDAERHRGPGTLENDPVLVDMGLMWLPAVVKPGSDVHNEGHLTAHAPEHAYQLVPVGGDRGTGDRHEVDDFPDP